MISENFILVGAAIAFAGTVKYLLDTLSGKTKPNRVSWLIWAVAPMIAFFAELSEGVGLQSLLTFMVGFSPALVFIASFVNKKSYWELTKVDYVFGALAALGIVLWLVTGDGNLAIAFAIAADAMGVFPTLIKGLKDPASESAWLFLTGMINAGLVMLTIDTWDFAHYAFPLYIFVACLLMWSTVQLKIGPRIKNLRSSSVS